MKLRSSNSKVAFTLIELSVVILIIGILIAGVMTATGLVKKSKIAAAQSLTKSSPIGGIPDNALWLESSLDSSFKETETSSGDPVSIWYDQKNYTNKSSVVPGGNGTGVGPTYSNTINYIHAVKFAGNSNNYLKIADASFLNNTDYTIVILEKRQSANAGYFIGDSSVTTANQTLVLGYSADAQVTHSQGSGNSYPAKITAYSGENPRVFTFISDSVQGKKTYINGVLAAQSSDTNKLSGISELAIGKGYTGEIGEIAIFTRALKIDERKATEDYLGKKFATKINRDAIAGGSCVNGTVTSDSCILDCYTSGIVGLTSPSTVSNGASGVTGTCGASGYTGTITLSCSNGILTPSGACAVQQCSYNVTGASPATGLVNPGTSTIACNTASHYSSSGFPYTCSGGASISGTCACDTGYTGAGCTTCDAANGYGSDGNGGCAMQCTVTGVSGITDGTKVNYATSATATPCNASGYSGTINYTCNGTTFTPIGSCVVGTACTGGVVDTTTVPGSVIHKFLSSGTLNCTTAGAKSNAQILIVAGGAGGTSSSQDGGGGGGGAGGVVYVASGYSIAATSYSVVVGNGGAGGNGGGDGTAGSNSSFNGMVAFGGGTGGKWTTSVTTNGANGGSGGGAGGAYGANGGASTQTAQTGETAHYGNAGGNTSTTPPNELFTGGGGGGAGAAGGAGGAVSVGGAGGAGISLSITGTATYYAAGGGGSGGKYSTGGSGGSGIGGSGGVGSGYTSTNGTNGATNTGSGGGGANKVLAGSGGSGIVIIRY